MHVADIHKPLSIATLVLIGLGVLATIASGAWFFAIGPDPLPVAETPLAETRTAPPISVERVAAMHLFGQPGTDAVPTENLKETRLSLVLVGVFVADAEEQSTAVIAAQKGSTARLYRVNDRLPGNVILQKVYRDRVVLSRGGVHELLRFEQTPELVQRAPDHQAEPTAERSTQRISLDGDSAIQVKRELIASREEVERDPRQYVEDLGLRTSADGGYVLGTFADNDDFLQPTDRLLSVNGRRVGNPDEDSRYLEQMVEGATVDVELQRGKQRLTFTLSLESLN